jgi:hypothetical protein
MCRNRHIPVRSHRSHPSTVLNPVFSIHPFTMRQPRHRRDPSLRSLVAGGWNPFATYNRVISEIETESALWLSKVRSSPDTAPTVSPNAARTRGSEQLRCTSSSSIRLATTSRAWAASRQQRHWPVRLKISRIRLELKFRIPSGELDLALGRSLTATESKAKTKRLV